MTDEYQEVQDFHKFLQSHLKDFDKHSIQSPYCPQNKT